MTTILSRILQAGALNWGFAGAILVLSQTIRLVSFGQTVWPGTIVAKHGINLNGNGVYSDSFDSADTNKSTYGKYDSSKYKGDGGDVTSQDGMEDPIGGQSANIYGHVHTGPIYALSLGTSGSVGSHAWQVGNIGVEPGWLLQDANFTFPDTTLPDTTGYHIPTGPYTNITTITTYTTNQISNSDTYPEPVTPWTVIITNIVTVTTSTVSCTAYPAAGTYVGNVQTNVGSIVISTTLPAAGCYIPGTITPRGAGRWQYVPIISYTYTNVATYSYTYATYATNVYYFTNVYDFVLHPNQKYSYDSGFSGKTVLIEGPNVTLVLKNGLVGTERFTWNIGSSLIVYAGGTSASLSGEDYLNPNGSSSSFVLFCTPTVSSLSLNGNGQFTGVLVAPNADMRFNGGGSSNQDFCGSVMCNSVLFSGRYSFHFDESLRFSSVSAPIINKQPISQAAAMCSNAAFQVTAAGTAPLIYQWRLNGQNILGATNSTLAVGSMQVSNVGSYTVTVTNIFGGATSDVAILTIATPPDFLWARIVTNTVNGYTGESSAQSMAIDGSGNVFVAGLYQGWGVDFGGAVLSNSLINASSATFLCKYDASGNFLWARQFSTNSVFAQSGLRVATDTAGNLYAAGDYVGTATFGTNIIVSASGQETFVAKYSADGQGLWARRIGASDPYQGGFGRGLAVDSNNMVVLMSACSTGADFGTTNITGVPAFLAKYDLSGNLLWARGAGTLGTSIGLGISGSIYACSQTNLTRYDNVGAVIWSRPFGRGQSLALDADENIYVTGWGTGVFGDLTITNVNGSPDFFAARCDASGTLAWSRQIGSTNQEMGIAIAVDCFRNLYISATSASARWQASLNFGNSTLTNFVAMLMKYDAAGNPLWAKAIAGTNRATPWAVAVLNPDAVYMAGTFYSFAQFGNFSFATPNQTSLRDLYVAKLDGMEPPALPQITSQPLSQKVRAGTTPSLNVTVPSGIPLSYQWYFNASNAVGANTDASLVFTNVQTNASGAYQVTVANAYGSMTSSIANLTVYLTEAASLSSPIGPSSGGTMKFQIGGVSGFNYAVEASTNLHDWIPLMTNTSPFQFSDPNAAAFPNRCYRVRWVPGP